MTVPTHRTLDDLTHSELAVLAHEYLMAGHLIDRAGAPVMISDSAELMEQVAIDEWMGASPIYSKRTQRLLGFESTKVETCLKNMQLDIGAPPEFLDFRMQVIDDTHGAFHLDHCGALMDVEPMGDEFVHSMCHHIEDPTFDATGWATHPKLRMHPVHRPPRVAADRQPHCAWTVVIDESVEATPEPAVAQRIGESLLAQLPLAAIGEPAPGDDGLLDYAGPLDPDLRLRHFAEPTLRALLEEFALQAHLLVLSFGLAVETRKGTEAAVDAMHQQFTGVAGVATSRIKRAFGLGDSPADVATVFSFHPAFRPSSYVAWDVALDDDVVRLTLGDCPALEEQGFLSWPALLADGYDRSLGSIAAAVDPHWQVAADGPRRWVVGRSEVPAAPYPEVAVTEFSTGATHVFIR